MACSPEPRENLKLSRFSVPVYLDLILSYIVSKKLQLQFLYKKVMIVDAHLQLGII